VMEVATLGFSLFEIKQRLFLYRHTLCQKGERVRNRSSRLTLSRISVFSTSFSGSCLRQEVFLLHAQISKDLSH
jgi:hypothetical protein